MIIIFATQLILFSIVISLQIYVLYTLIFDELKKIIKPVKNKFVI
jgi:hypothetical protein